MSPKYAMFVTQLYHIFQLLLLIYVTQWWSSSYAKKAQSVMARFRHSEECYYITESADLVSWSSHVALGGTSTLILLSKSVLDISFYTVA